MNNKSVTNSIFPRKIVNIDTVLRDLALLSESFTPEEKDEFIKENCHLKENMKRSSIQDIKELLELIEQYKYLKILLVEELELLRVDLEYMEELTQLDEKHSRENALNKQPG